MNEKDMIQMKESITMPAEMAGILLQNCSQTHRSHNRYSRYSKICAVLAAFFCITAIGSTSYAAYNVYQEKQLAIFMDFGLTQEEKAALGDQLAKMPEISSCRYINGDEAWEEFKAAYLTEEIAAAIEAEGNPLKDSDNYEVSVRLGADTQAVRDKISLLDGVRKITTIRELEADDSTQINFTYKKGSEPAMNWAADVKVHDPAVKYVFDENWEDPTNVWVTIRWYTDEELNESN